MNAKLLGLFALVAAALLVVALHKSDGPVAADTPHTGLNFSIGIDTNADGVDDCSTSGSPGSFCSLLLVSRPVVVNVYLDSAGLPNGYQGYQILFEQSNGFFQGTVLHTWPDCGAAQGPTENTSNNSVAFGCYVSPWNHVSTYTGKIAEAAFYLCSSPNNTLSLVHGAAGTRLIDSGANAHAEEEGTRESLDINCSPPTPTPIGGPCTSNTLGDVDNDNDVDAIDALFLLQSTVGPRFLACTANADVNHSSSVDAVDGQLILQKVAGLISVFP